MAKTNDKGKRIPKEKNISPTSLSNVTSLDSNYKENKILD